MPKNIDGSVPIAGSYNGQQITCLVDDQGRQYVILIPSPSASGSLAAKVQGASPSGSAAAVINPMLFGAVNPS